MVDDGTAPWVGRCRARGLGHRRLLATAVVLLVALAGCGSDGNGPAPGRPPQAGQAMPEEQRQALRIPGAPATLSDLQGLDEVKTLFNQHQDVPQLILLLSPT